MNRSVAERDARRTSCVLSGVFLGLALVSLACTAMGVAYACADTLALEGRSLTALASTVYGIRALWLVFHATAIPMLVYVLFCSRGGRAAFALARAAQVATFILLSFYVMLFATDFHVLARFPVPRQMLGFTTAMGALAAALACALLYGLSERRQWVVAFGAIPAIFVLLLALAWERGARGAVGGVRHLMGEPYVLVCTVAVLAGLALVPLYRRLEGVQGVHTALWLFGLVALTAVLMGCLRAVIPVHTPITRFGGAGSLLSLLDPDVVLWAPEVVLVALIVRRRRARGSTGSPS